MSDFSYNTDEIDVAISSYKEASNDIEEVKAELSEQIKKLQEDGWKSKSGEKFFSKFTDDWEKSVDNYVMTIEYMTKLLEEAKAEFNDLSKEAEGLTYGDT